MIHFTCDGCERRIDISKEPRYVLHMEVYLAPDADFVENADAFNSSAEADLISDPERDHLAELDDLLEQVDNFTSGDRQPLPEKPADDYRQVRYDLCSECRQRVLQNPLGRLALTKIDFSEN